MKINLDKGFYLIQYGIKPYNCKDCGKEFTEKGNLIIHRRIHTGEKPFFCNFENCTKTFKAHGHLEDHKKTHINIKCFECEICGKSFGRKNIWETHILIHTGKKPFKCEYDFCKKVFLEKGNMRTHMKTHVIFFIL